MDGDALSGHALGLRIAAGNAPNLVDLATGGLGPVIQGLLNSTQTTSLATRTKAGKVFGLELPIADVAEGCKTMDERRAIKALLRL